MLVMPQFLKQGFLRLGRAADTMALPLKLATSMRARRLPLPDWPCGTALYPDYSSGLAGAMGPQDELDADPGPQFVPASLPLLLLCKDQLSCARNADSMFVRPKGYEPAHHPSRFLGRHRCPRAALGMCSAWGYLTWHSSCAPDDQASVRIAGLLGTGLQALQKELAPTQPVPTALLIDF